MFYIIVILVGIFAMPANALDGTPSSTNIAPLIAIAPIIQHMPDSEFWHNPNLLEEFQRWRKPLRALASIP
jgi:hypothetical protein